MQDDLNFFPNGRRPQFFSNGRQPQFIFQMEDDLNLFLQDGLILFLQIEDNEKQSHFPQMEDDFKFFQMEDDLNCLCLEEYLNFVFKCKTNLYFFN
jgi:hypothetical protein